MLNKFKTYFKAILIPVLVGGIVGFLISGSIDYNSLEKPLFFIKSTSNDKFVLTN